MKKASIWFKLLCAWTLVAIEALFTLPSFSHVQNSSPLLKEGSGQRPHAYKKIKAEGLKKNRYGSIKAPATKGKRLKQKKGILPSFLRLDKR